jgi:hypothetical protein
MPKPLTSGALSLGDVYGAVAGDLMQRIGDAQAAAAGPPISDEVEPATDKDRAEAWWARRPEATDDAMMQLAQQKYAEHRQAGMDDQKAQAATAEDLTHFRYGQRLKLYTYGQVGFKAQVDEAKRLRRLAARESTPDPEPHPPTMPSAALTNAAAQPSSIAGPVGQTLPETPMPPEPAPTTAMTPPSPAPGGY